MHTRDIKKLKTWFLSKRRDLPWRERPTPYEVWISEVMLQQTQVSVVIPYFLRWIKKFPDISALAKAPIEEVLKEWEGLGYYSRARNLHDGARYVVENHGGILPDSSEDLLKIKGIGDYTVGAILSFAYHKRAAAVDGNVLRVLSRYYCIEENICQGKVQKKIRSLAQELLPEKDPWVVSESLIELGATVCMRKAKCGECPLIGGCGAFSSGKADVLPMKGAKMAITQLYRLVMVLKCGDKLLVRRGMSGKLMADLFQFPYFDISSNEGSIDEQKKMMRQHLKKELGLDCVWNGELEHIKHSFTRYRAYLMPHVYIVGNANEVKEHLWIRTDDLKKVPFASGHRHIFAKVVSSSP